MGEQRLAYRDERIDRGAGGGRAGPIGRLTAVIVDEEARGKGVGRTLVAAAEAALRERGCAMIEITSNKKRIDAHAFYERLGYTATSFRFAKQI
ncbi:MAG: GNAT family N-acetyltransferase [Gemmatimonadaceae bacterium]